MLTLHNKVYHSYTLDFSIGELPVRKIPGKILMVSPEYFDIVDVKNAHMEGQQGKLDKVNAILQWQELKNIYEEWKNLGAIEEVAVIPGAIGCEDMVFAANQSFPWSSESGQRQAIISKMKHSSRQKEVPFFEKFYRENGYEIFHLNSTDLFEGMGDTIPHPEKNLLFGGYGHRSDPSAYEEISRLLNVPVIALKLINENFYHLDTCFVPLDNERVLICREAFNEDGFKLIQSIFKTVIEVPLLEAVQGFALNAHVYTNRFNGNKLAVIQKGNMFTTSILRENGFKVWETETSEYMKSGGSVFCMKMMFY